MFKARAAAAAAVVGGLIIGRRYAGGLMAYGRQDFF
jgi:hypothetical protein